MHTRLLTVVSVREDGMGSEKFRGAGKLFEFYILLYDLTPKTEHILVLFINTCS